MRKRINAGYIFGAIFVIGLFLTVGTMGALEGNLIEIPRAIVQSVLFTGIAFVGLLGIKLGGYDFN